MGTRSLPCLSPRSPMFLRLREESGSGPGAEDTETTQLARFCAFSKLHLARGPHAARKPTCGCSNNNFTKGEEGAVGEC